MKCSTVIQKKILVPTVVYIRRAVGKGGKGGGNKADDEDVSLDDFAGIPETKARYDKCLEVCCCADH